MLTFSCALPKISAGILARLSCRIVQWWYSLRILVTQLQYLLRRQPKHTFVKCFSYTIGPCQGKVQLIFPGPIMILWNAQFVKLVQIKSSKYMEPMLNVERDLQGWRAILWYFYDKAPTRKNGVLFKARHWSAGLIMSLFLNCPEYIYTIKSMPAVRLCFEFLTGHI